MISLSATLGVGALASRHKGENFFQGLRLPESELLAWELKLPPPKEVELSWTFFSSTLGLRRSFRPLTSLFFRRRGLQPRHKQRLASGFSPEESFSMSTPP